jgi:serine/threonine protein kinase
MAEDERNLDRNTIALTSGGSTTRLLRVGDVIGETYRIKGLIGRGGMGYVFRAEHTIIGKDYALKMLSPDQINETTWSRFQSEGKAIARLDHPSIVKIYNMGVDRGDCPYYVMDLLDGVALSDCIAEKMALSVDEILDIFIQLALGFGYAHSRGIIHRDVKPSNIMLVDTGEKFPTAKIVDFGIAKVTGAKDVKNQSLTATGEVFGSPYYMSPEQCLGTEIDHRADINSLGCTLFEALCGHPPFVGQGAIQTVMMHQNAPSPTVESVGGKFSSDEMEALIAKMLMKRPADRYQSMEQVRHDLERIRQNKVVGKNIETGFRSSADSHFKEIGSRYEEEQQNKSRRRKILISCTVVVVGLAIGVSSLMIFIFNTPNAKPPKATLSSSGVTVGALDSALEQRDPALLDAEKKFKATKSITSSIDKATGERVFHCPEVHMGAFYWHKGQKNTDISDFDSRIYGRIDAYGETRVPADEPITLALDISRNREAWHEPICLTKFGAREINGLRLLSQGRVDEIATDAERKAQDMEVVALVKAISGWTNCQAVEFDKIAVPDEALVELDKHRELRRFSALTAPMDPKVLAKRQFLQRLAYLELSPMDDCDLVLNSLKGSTALESITISHSLISVAGFHALATCPNLKILYLANCPIKTPALEAIIAIKSLKKLRIYGTK